MTETSPFVPGARVAVRSAWGDDYREAFIDKVYKSGNFILRGDDSRQQWHPWSSDGIWHANQTTAEWGRRDSLMLWDERVDKQISESIAATTRRKRWTELRRKIERMKEGNITDALLDALDAALAQGIVTQRAETALAGSGSEQRERVEPGPAGVRPEGSSP